MSQQTTNFYHNMEVCATTVFTIEYIMCLELFIQCSFSCFHCCQHVAALWILQNMQIPQRRVYSCVESEIDVDLIPGWSRCKMRVWLMCSAASIIDTVSLISLYLDVCIASNVFRGVVSLRLLRLFTLFRLERRHKFFSPILIVISNKRTELGATLGIAGLLLLISSTLMYYVESAVNPKFNSILASMWWGTETLTTVGYGDNSGDSWRKGTGLRCGICRRWLVWAAGWYHLFWIFGDFLKRTWSLLPCFQQKLWKTVVSWFSCCFWRKYRHWNLWLHKLSKVMAGKPFAQLVAVAGARLEILQN